MPFSHLEIIWVVGWRNFDGACTELFIHHLVSHNWNTTTIEWVNDVFSDNILLYVTRDLNETEKRQFRTDLVTFVGGMDSNRRITQHGFNTRGSHHNLLIFIVKKLRENDFKSHYLFRLTRCLNGICKRMNHSKFILGRRWMPGHRQQCATSQFTHLHLQIRQSSI